MRLSVCVCQQRARKKNEPLPCLKGARAVALDEVRGHVLGELVILFNSARMAIGSLGEVGWCFFCGKKEKKRTEGAPWIHVLMPIHPPPDLPQPQNPGVRPHYIHTYVAEGDAYLVELLVADDARAVGAQQLHVPRLAPLRHDAVRQQLGLLLFVYFIIRGVVVDFGGGVVVGG